MNLVDVKLRRDISDLELPISCYVNYPHSYFVSTNIICNLFDATDRKSGNIISVVGLSVNNESESM
jgi:hypothetical protein